MKRTVFILLALVASATLYFGTLWSSAVKSDESVTLVKEPFTVWTPYQGQVESRKVEMIASKFKGGATVIELVPEGERVSKGTVLVRFDASELEREKVKLKRDYALALSELESLENAKLPLGKRELEVKLLELSAKLDAEAQYLKSLNQLAAENLASGPEVNQQKMKVEKVKTELDTLKLKVQLTKDYLHPSELKRARAKVASARQELDLAREQIENSVIKSPRDGVVVYKPIGVGEEYRTVRVGDTVYQNQPFMVLPDMEDLIVRIAIPEGELARVREGMSALVQPLAFPGLNLEGVVETVGSMAQSAPERPRWQKFFNVVIGLKTAKSGVRPGMTVTAQVRSYQKSDALLIPRSAVKWREKEPYCELLSGSVEKVTFLKLGWSDDSRFEVMSGLNAGDEVKLN